jgi:hypothetical protein
VRVRQITRRGEGRLDSAAEVNAHDIARAPTGGELRVPSLPAAAFEHELISKELRRDGREPAAKLLFVARVGLREMLPLPTEVLCRRRFLAFNLARLDETRHTAPHRKLSRANFARQLPFQNLLPPARLILLGD